jgi:DNA mismatch repair ATPase MutS
MNWEEEQALLMGKKLIFNFCIDFFFQSYSIAYAVLKHFADNLPCRILFATHYHLLTEEFKDHKKIGMYQMEIFSDNGFFLYLLSLG